MLLSLFWDPNDAAPAGQWEILGDHRAGTHAELRGRALILNPAPARALSEAVLAQQPSLAPNEEELEALTGQTDEEGPDPSMPAAAPRSSSPSAPTERWSQTGTPSATCRHRT